MTASPTFRILRPSLTSTHSDAVLPFLIPAVNYTRIAPVARFSTSPALWKRDNNKNRGLSVLRHTGPRPRQTLSVKQKDYKSQQLPKPVELDQEVVGDPDHGLWDFFKDQKLLRTPVEESRHGRAWTVGELRNRNWDTLHALWWVCVKERNRLATEKIERARLQAGYGDYENEKRDRTVQETMKAILDTLAERHTAYEEAYELARNDPTIDLDRTDGPQYMEPAYSEEAFDEVEDTQPQPEYTPYSSQVGIQSRNSEPLKTKEESSPTQNRAKEQANT